jgi:hypothetical protein
MKIPVAQQGWPHGKPAAGAMALETLALCKHYCAYTSLDGPMFSYHSKRASWHDGGWLERRKWQR